MDVDCLSVVFQHMSVKARLRVRLVCKLWDKLSRNTPINSCVLDRRVIRLGTIFHPRLFTNIKSNLLTDDFRLFPNASTINIHHDREECSYLAFKDIHRLNIHARFTGGASVSTNAKIVDIHSYSTNINYYEDGITLRVNSDIVYVNCDAVTIIGNVKKLYVFVFKLDIKGCTCGEILMVGGNNIIGGETATVAYITHDEFNNARAR